MKKLKNRIFSAPYRHCIRANKALFYAFKFFLVSMIAFVCECYLFKLNYLNTDVFFWLLKPTAFIATICGCTILLSEFGMNTYISYKLTLYELKKYGSTDKSKEEIESLSYCNRIGFELAITDYKKDLRHA